MNRDEYGGCTAVRARASGFFRVEQIAGQRWWFVTPTGHGFLSVAANHLEPRFLQGSYNRDHWADVLADAPAGYTRMVVADARAWNLTALGYGGGYANPRFPYVRAVRLPGVSTWQETGVFPDPFAPEFAVAAKEAALRACAPVVGDPWLIGYLLNDCLEWPRWGVASKRRSANWLDALKSGGPNSAGKRAYVSLMRERHNDKIAGFNAVYGTRFAAFDDLLRAAAFAGEPPRDPQIARDDDEAFLLRLARRFYQTAREAIRSVDADHLILGEVLEGNRGIPAPVLDAARESFDVLSVQFYGAWKDQAADVAGWHAQTGLPILLADSCYSVATESMPRPCGPRVGSHAERADAFERYARQVLRVPHVVGWHWCGYIDGSLELEPRHQHMGLKDAWGRPHQPLSDRVRDVFAQLYERATEKETL